MTRESPVSQTWQNVLLLAIHHAMLAHAKTVVALALLISVVALGYTYRRLEFLTGRNQLIAAEKPYLQSDEAYTQTFSGLEELVVVATGPDLDESKAFIQHLAEHLQQDPEHIKEVFYRVDLSSLHGKKLLLLSPDELQTLRKQLEAHQDVLRKVLTSPSLNTLLVEINHEVNSAMAAHLVQSFLGLQTGEDPQDHVPLSLSFLQSLLEQMKSVLTSSRAPYRSPWATLLGHDTLSGDSFLVSDDQRLVFLLVEPQVQGDGFTARQESISALRQQITALRQEFPQVQVGVTGEKALENDEMVTAQANSSLATKVSLIGVSLLYFVFFRSVWRTFLVLITILVGLSWSLGMVTLTVGHLSLISIFVAPILIGLADDRIVYFLSCYAEERDHGQSVLDALAATVTHAAPGIVAAACTNALAFYAMILTDFRGIQELGFITGTGILLSCIVALTFLPALLALTDGKILWQHPIHQNTPFPAISMRWGAQLQHFRRAVLIFAGGVSFLCVLTLPFLTFDSNLLHLQARDTESVSWEQRVLEHTGRSSWFALTTAPSLADATRKAIRFEALPSVEKVESIQPFIPEGQEKRMLLVRNLEPFVPELSTPLASPRPVRVEQLKNSLEDLQFKLQRSGEDEHAQNNPAAQDLTKVRITLAEVLDLLRARPLSQVGLALDSFQDKLFQDFANTWALLRDNLHPSGPLTLADIPPQLRSRFVSADQTQFLLQIYPRQNIWEWQPLSEFVTQLRQVDPQVTGSPVIGYESIRTITHGYAAAGLYATVAILLVVVFTLRRLRLSGLVMLPVVLGLLWTAGFMWLWGLKLNLANLVAIPITIGLGVESGMYFVRRASEDKVEGWQLVGGSTGQAVAVFSLSTIVSFGSLMVASHYGIFSMGLLLTVAVGNVLLASLVVLPLFLSTNQQTSEIKSAALSLPTALIAQDLVRNGEDRRVSQ